MPRCRNDHCYFEARPKNRSNRGRFMPLGKRSLFIPGCVQGAIITLVCLSVCVSHLSFLRIARAVRGQFPQPRDLWKRVSVGERVGRVYSHAVSRWSRSPDCCGFRGACSVGRFFSRFPQVCVSKFVHPEQSASTRRRGSDSHRICPPRPCAHLSPSGVPFIMLPPAKYGIISGSVK